MLGFAAYKTDEKGRMRLVAKGGKQSRHSASLYAGLTFPVGRIKRQLKQKVGKRMRVSVGAAVYSAAVLEYLSAEILEISGNVSRSFKQKRVSPRHIKLAVSHDEEMNKLLEKVTIPGGGVVPHIHPAILKRRASDKNKQGQALAVAPIVTSIKPKPVPKAITKPKGRAPRKIGKTKKPIAITVPKGKIGKKGGGGKGKGAGAGGITLLDQRTLSGGQKLSVISGDITNVACQVIVNPSSSNFSLSGQVGSRLQAVGGAAFTKSVQDLHTRHGPLASCDAAICDGVNFNAPLVMHCNGPTWSTAEASLPLLRKTVDNCLTAADTRKLKSICFPSIGSGVGNFPKQIAAQTILKSINDYVKSHASKVNDVIFILHDQESIDVYVTELARLIE